MLTVCFLNHCTCWLPTVPFSARAFLFGLKVRLPRYTPKPLPEPRLDGSSR
ncbi:hypothetical protein D3C87_2128020 [compost metagenome]